VEDSTAGRAADIVADAGSSKLAIPKQVILRGRFPPQGAMIADNPSIMGKTASQICWSVALVGADFACLELVSVVHIRP
jgi:hypothetical protein